MLLWKKLWYYTENYGTSIYEGKNMVDYQKPRNFDLWWKKLWKYTKTNELLNRYIALELWFTMEKLWYYGQNYVALNREQWNFDLPRKTTENYKKTKNIWIIIEKKTMLKLQNYWSFWTFIALELWFTMDNLGYCWKKVWYYGKKTMLLWKKNYDTMEKTMIQYRKLWNFLYTLEKSMVR